jgi:hypothetical protein
LADNVDTLTLSFADKSGEQVVGSVNDAAKKGAIRELGWTVPEFIAALSDPDSNSIKIGGLSLGGGHDAGSFIVNVLDKSEGREKNQEYIPIHISSGISEIRDMMLPTKALQDAILAGESASITTGVDYTTGEVQKINVSPSVEKVNGKWRYKANLEEEIINPVTGEVVSRGPIRFEEIADDAFNQVINSPYLGFDFGNTGSKTKPQ